MDTIAVCGKLGLLVGELKLNACQNTNASNNTTSHTTSYTSSNTTEEVHFPRAVGLDTTEIEVEAEGRVKSLQLRLQGQLQTIRSLEGQLGDALQLVEARNKQLAHCNARLKAAATNSSAQSAGNSVNNTSTLGQAGNVNIKSDAAAAKAAELAEQYKVRRMQYVLIFDISDGCVELEV